MLQQVRVSLKSMWSEKKHQYLVVLCDAGQGECSLGIFQYEGEQFFYCLLGNRPKYVTTKAEMNSDVLWVV